MAESEHDRKTVIETRHYFVDEGGDSNLFSSKGKLIIETPGCSRFFMLGLLDLPDPKGLQSALDDLRASLLNDPYFKNVPSMQAKAKKTALAFHAKDDLPEVRREVFTLLRNIEGLRYFSVVTDKWRVLDYVRQQNERNLAYRYHPNELYDYLVRRLFKNLLHKDSSYNIVFSKRGKSDRTTALMAAIETARQRFARQWGISSVATINLLAHHRNRKLACRRLIILLGRYNGFMRRVKIAICYIFGLRFTWYKILMTNAGQAMASITHRKSRSMRRLWLGVSKIKRQGYRIVRTVVLQSHGMEPNFVHWQTYYIEIQP